MKVAIIGSGVSAIIAAKTFLEYNCTVYLVDAENYKEKIYVNKSNKFFPKINKSPKFQSKTILNSFAKFKSKYKIKTKNFFLASGLISGGLSNFWGAGIEVPNSNYLKKYPNGKSILKEKDYINKEIGLDPTNFSFYNLFYNQKIVKNFLKKKNKSVYFSKLPLALKQFNKKKLTIEYYKNLDLLNNNSKVYNAKDQIPELLKNKNFKYIPNIFVKNIVKHKNNYMLISLGKKKLNFKFDKVVISAGTVGSTILVDRVLNLREKYRLFHTPTLKLMYFNLLLPFKGNHKITFSLPLLNLNVFLKKEKFVGSFMYLNYIKNTFFGISKNNILFTFFKKFFYVGNIFLSPNYSNTYISLKNRETLIYSNNTFNKNELASNLKKKINSFFAVFNFFEFFPQNLKYLENGSDAHYSSTLINKVVGKKKLINKNCEINNLKNVHVIDGSIIREGLHYPTYFLMIYVRYIVKKIIKNEKKNKN